MRQASSLSIAAGLTVVALLLCTVASGSPGCRGFQYGGSYFFGDSFTPVNPRYFAVGDFNGDQKSDLAVTTYEGSVWIVLVNGDGTFAPAVSYPLAGSASVAVGDFNSDNKIDLAVTTGSPGLVSILLGNGDGTFGAPANYGSGGGGSLVVADFNGDAKSDLAVANLSSGKVSILIGNGDGSFAAGSDYAAGSDADAMAVDDFNHDGKNDLAVTNHSSNGVSILLGDGKGAFATPVTYSVSSGATGGATRSIAVADFNGDGKSDLAVAIDPFPSPGGVSILRGNGDGTFAPAPIFYVYPRTVSVAAADFDADGKVDLATAHFLIGNFGNAVVSFGKGDGTFNDGLLTGAGVYPTEVAIGDFNADGRPDLAVLGSSSKTSRSS